MPSRTRKKAKGKARKAAKAKEAKAEEESRAVVEVAVNERQARKEWLETQMQRLRISESSTTMCRHGLVPLSPDEEKLCREFIAAFTAEFFSQHNNFREGFIAASKVVDEKYPDVYSSKLDAVISMLLTCGTQCILDGVYETARLYACLAGFFEGSTATAESLRKPTATPVELGDADDHTLVSFYRKRIPCACLDEKYKEVKSVKKMGLCYNPDCSQPGGRMERSKMFCCTRCVVANYCSVECQRADWKRHKEFCAKAAEMKAALIAEQS